MSNLVQGLVWNIAFPNPVAKIIALKLADNASDEGESIFPSINHICEKTSCSRGIVYKWIAALEYCQVLKVVHRSAGGSQNERTERAFDMDLLRQLSRPNRKTPPKLALRVITILRPKVRDDGTQLRFDGADKMVPQQVFEIVPWTGGPVLHADGSPKAPVLHKDGSKAAPVLQKDGTRPRDGRDPSSTRTRTVKESVTQPLNIDPAKPPAGAGETAVDDLILDDDRQREPAAPKANPFANCHELIPGDTTMEPLWQAQAHAAGRAAPTMSSERLPFATSALVKIRRLCVDREALVARYQQKTKGKRIKNPSGYLLRMAYEEVAKRDGIPLDQVEAMYSEDRATREKAQAAALGIEPPKPPIGAAKTSGAALAASLDRLAQSMKSRGSAQ